MRRHDPRAPAAPNSLQELASRGRLADADEQPRPEVAERPEDLIVYGGSGKAARNPAAFDAIVTSLKTARATTRRCWSNRASPSGCSRPTQRAPRVLISNAMLVPAWANWDEFHRLEALGLTMYGQMTAGSWIYIGTQGILQGTYETLAELAARSFGGSLAGTRRSDRRARWAWAARSRSRSR